MSKNSKKKFERIKEEVDAAKAAIIGSKAYELYKKSGRSRRPYQINLYSKGCRSRDVSSVKIELKDIENFALVKNRAIETSEKEAEKCKLKIFDELTAPKMEQQSESEKLLAIEKKKLAVIIKHFRSIDMLRGREAPKEDMSEKSTTRATGSPYEDNRYVYYLKKLKLLANYSNRDITKKYVLDKSKALRDRCGRNEAGDLGQKTYRLAENSPERVVVEAAAIGKDETAKITQIKLNKIREYEYFKIDDDYDRGEFEYAVYKFEDDLVKISNYLEMPIQQVILLYYTNHFTHRITDALCEIVAVREWCPEDKELFAACYRKHGRKIENYFNHTFQELKTEEDLRLYYFYYNNKIIGETWSFDERGVFQYLFDVFKKDWIMYTPEGIKIINSGCINDAISYRVLNKHTHDIKSYYNNYFKRLSDEEMRDDAIRYNANYDWLLLDKMAQRYALLDRKKKRKLDNDNITERTE
ncbi:hypothetical protein ECANGB1_967 [Enterospora canceri]|uniref:Uncharacterized protein n=1 Tax=Enterospora canceri TaxID=1081671 RepID=A0A1Y1S725_9MICR|nr:hypothetical protein ECANGB1_967 [Enterospora canceri]